MKKYNIGLDKVGKGLVSLLYLVFFLGLVLPSYSQKFIQLGGKENDYISDSYMDKDGNWYILGKSRNAIYLSSKDTTKGLIKYGGINQFDKKDFYFITKISNSGNVIWKHIIGASMTGWSENARLIKKNNSFVLTLSAKSHIDISSSKFNKFFDDFNNIKWDTICKSVTFARNNIIYNFDRNGDISKCINLFNPCNTMVFNNFKVIEDSFFLQTNNDYNTDGFFYINTNKINIDKKAGSLCLVLDSNFNLVRKTLLTNLFYERNYLSNQNIKYSENAKDKKHSFFYIPTNPGDSIAYINNKKIIIPKANQNSIYSYDIIKDTITSIQKFKSVIFNTSAFDTRNKLFDEQRIKSKSIIDTTKGGYHILYDYTIKQENEFNGTNIYNIRNNKVHSVFTPLNFKRRNDTIEKSMNSYVVPSNKEGEEFLLYTASPIDTSARNDLYYSDKGDSIKSSDYSMFLVSYDTVDYKPKKIYPLFNNVYEPNSYPDGLMFVSSVMEAPDKNLWIACHAKPAYNFLNHYICAKDTLGNTRGGTDIYLINITKNFITGIKEDKKAVSTQDVDGSSILSFNVYPNPTIQNINLQYILKENLEVEIGLYSLRGHKLAVLKEKTKMTSGAYLEQFYLDKDLASGVYLVKIKAANETLSKRVSVVK